MMEKLNILEKLWSFFSKREVVSSVRISADLSLLFTADELYLKTTNGGVSYQTLKKGEAMLLAREIVRNYALGPGGSSLIKELNER